MHAAGAACVAACDTHTGATSVEAMLATPTISAKVTAPAAVRQAMLKARGVVGMAGLVAVLRGWRSCCDGVTISDSCSRRDPIATGRGIRATKRTPRG
jgi:hypothetical protein